MLHALVRSAVLLPLLTLTLFALVLCGTPAGAALVATRAFVSDTDHARVNHDRRPYDGGDQLTNVAQRWAEWMAEHRTLQHNPSLGSQIDDWSELGENVGRGESENSIHRAFMDSPGHRANILSRSYTRMGVGTAWGGGRLYVCEVFKRPT